MSNFLVESNYCAQNLLAIVSKGNSIIAEILRLKDHIPVVFRMSTREEQQKYCDIILDFRYFKIADAHERRINDDARLRDLDNEIRSNYIDLLNRFYSAFENIYQYYVDLKTFVEELSSGFYTQQTIESVLHDDEGKQLMSESLHLLGVILIALDLHMPGLVRERLLISHYRYSGMKSHSGDSNLDDICRLLCSTGLLVNESTEMIPSYLECYFNRCKIDEVFVNMIISKLCSDDIFNQLSIYPNPEHRSMALSSQAAMLVVCLFFSPNILHTQFAQMREIVDKFFYDNWVISIYMGITMNIIDAWHHYMAAKCALEFVIDYNAVKGYSTIRREKLTKVLQETNYMLQDGILTENFVLKNLTSIIALIIECNFLLRWYLTHTSVAVFKITAMHAQDVQQWIKSEPHFKREDLFDLLLNCGELELTTKEILRDLNKMKNERWNMLKQRSINIINELAKICSGSGSFMKIEKNLQLTSWLTEVAKQIDTLPLTKTNMCRHTITQLTQALGEVQKFHNLYSNMQVRQYLEESCDCLYKMMQVINIREDILINIQLVSDLSYAWRIIDKDYTDIMRERIKKNPNSVIKLRAVFLKLASALETPLLRINQAKSEDLISVSSYYSSELKNYIKKVIQIIPETMFNIMKQIIHLEIYDLKKMTLTHIDKKHIKQWTQFDVRYVVSELTYLISVFTEGILKMKNTLIGITEIDPKQLLEDGIREEYIRGIAATLNVGFTFDGVGNSKESLKAKITTLTNDILAYRHSFEYTRDYLNVHLGKILREETKRVVVDCNNVVEREGSNIINAVVHDKIVDTKFMGHKVNLTNFISRLADEIICYTAPKNVIYLDMKCTWYERSVPNKIVIEPCFFSMLYSILGAGGLVHLDRIYAQRLLGELTQNLAKIHEKIVSDQKWIDALREIQNLLELQDSSSACMDGSNLKCLRNVQLRWLKVWPIMLEWILNIGQKQILRQQLAHELCKSCTFNSSNVKSTLDTLNKAILSDVKWQQSWKTRSYNALEEVSAHSSYVGTVNPLEQIFCVPKETHIIALFLFAFIIYHLKHLQFCKVTKMLLPKSGKDQLDCVPMAVGTLTVLRQFRSDIMRLFTRYLCTYITLLIENNIRNNSSSSSSSSSSHQDICPETVTTIHFLGIFLRIAELPRSIMLEHIPPNVFSHYKAAVS